jgi:hypothetical protein
MLEESYMPNVQASSLTVVSFHFFLFLREEEEVEPWEGEKANHWIGNPWECLQFVGFSPVGTVGSALVLDTGTTVNIFRFILS